jgi:hypothetical protein
MDSACLIICASVTLHLRMARWLPRCHFVTLHLGVARWLARWMARCHFVTNSEYDSI